MIAVEKRCPACLLDRDIELFTRRWTDARTGAMREVVSRVCHDCLSERQVAQSRTRSDSARARLMELHKTLPPRECYTCKQTKPAPDFYSPASGRKNRLISTCADCRERLPSSRASRQRLDKPRSFRLTDYWGRAHATLFPGVPYHALTAAQRGDCYVEAVRLQVAAQVVDAAEYARAAEWRRSLPNDPPTPRMPLHADHTC